MNLTYPVTNETWQNGTFEILYTPVTTRVWYVFTSLLILGGVIGYTLLIIVISSHPQFRWATGKLILHQLAMDCIICCILFSLIAEAPFGRYLGSSLSFNCIAYYLVSGFFIIASNWHSFFLACNRYLALFSPNLFIQLTAPTALFATAALSYLIAIVLCLVGALGEHPILGRAPNGECGPLELRSARFVSLLSLGWFVPLFCTALLYLITLVKFFLKRRVEITAQNTSAATAERKRLNRRFAVTRILSVTFLWLLVCYLGTPISTSLFPEEKVKAPALTSWLHTALVCGYAATPFIFFAMSREYRRHFRKLFRRILFNKALETKSELELKHVQQTAQQTYH